MHWSLLLVLTCLFCFLRVLVNVHCFFFFFFQAEDGIRDLTVTGVQTCALPIWASTCRTASARTAGCWPWADATTGAAWSRPAAWPTPCPPACASPNPSPAVSA